jgi:hypothetical protein
MVRLLSLLSIQSKEIPMIKGTILLLMVLAALMPMEIAWSRNDHLEPPAEPVFLLTPKSLSMEQEPSSTEVYLSIPQSAVGLPRTAMAADDNIFFVNDMDVGIKGVFCAGKEDVGRQVFGPIGAKSSGAVERNVFPPRAECERLYAHMEDGAGWQFFHPYYDERFPDLLIQGGKLTVDERGHPIICMTYSTKLPDQYTLNPGMLFDTLTKHMRFGMRESDWERIAVPGLASPEWRGEYALRNGPWSLTKNGIIYKEIAPEQHIATQVEFVFSGSKFYPDEHPGFSAFSDWLNIFIQEQYTPWLFVWNGKAVAFTEEGRKLAPDAAALPEAMAGDMRVRWDAFADSFCAVFSLVRKTIPKPESEWQWQFLFDFVWEAIGEKMAAISSGTVEKAFIVFGDESTRIELELPIGTQKAVMRIIRMDNSLSMIIHSLALPLAPTAQAVKGQINDRGGKQRQGLADQQAADHGHPQGAAQFRSHAGAEHHGQGAEQRRHGGHQNGPQA